MKYIVVFLLLTLLTGCSDFSLPPKMIVADGQTYYACKGYVRSFQNSWGGDTYTVEFQERDGRKVQLRGISKLTITDIPAYVWSEMPDNLPDPKTAKEGSTVSDWRTPNKRAILANGVWQPIAIGNPVCTKSALPNGFELEGTSGIREGVTPYENSPAAIPDEDVEIIDAEKQVVTIEEWDKMTPQQQAAFKGVIDLPPPK